MKRFTKYRKVKSVIMLLTLCMVMGYSTYASAALIDKTETIPLPGSQEKQKVIITGKIPLPQVNIPVNREVFLEVLKSGMTKEDIKTKPKNEVMQYMDQTSANAATGEYSFEFVMDGDSGNYLMRIGFVGVNDNGEREKLFVYLSPKEFQQMLEGVNFAAQNDDAVKMKEVIEKYIERGILILPFYNLLKQQQIDLEPVYRTLTEKTVFKNPDDIVNYFSEAAVIQEINVAQDADKIIRIFSDSDHQKILAFNAGPFYTYNNTLSSDKRKAVNDKFVSTSFHSLENDIRPLFNELVVTNALSNISWLQVYDILQKNNDVLKIDYSKYNLLKKADQDNVLKQFAGRETYSSLSQIVSVFNELVERQNQINENKKTSSGPSGGSSSSSNKTGYSVQSIPMDQQMDENIVFIDLGSVSWAVEAVQSLAKKKIVVGRPGGEFSPNDAITREEFIKMLMMGSGLVASDASCDFSDVDKSLWYYPYVSSAKQLGIANGETESMFGIGKKITRQEIAALAYRVLKLKNVQITKAEDIEFHDVDIDNYAYEAINAMKTAKIIQGVGDNLFAPNDFSTRAQAAKIIYEILNFTESAGK